MKLSLELIEEVWLSKEVYGTFNDYLITLTLSYAFLTVNERSSEHIVGMLAFKALLTA